MESSCNDCFSPRSVRFDSMANTTQSGSGEADKTGRDNLEKAELLQLLTQRIAELPDIPRKILAMYYFENMRLAEIAEVFDLTESRICQIHAQTILGLRAWLQRVKER